MSLEMFNTQTIIYTTFALIIFVIALLAWVIHLEMKTRRLMRGKNGLSLEDSFLSMQNDLKEFEKFRGEIEKYLSNVEARMKTSARGIANVNFSAFGGMDSGGKSFATTLIDEKGDGVIISSLQARDRVSIFSKEIKNYTAEVELSGEEQESLTKAKESCNL